MTPRISFGLTITAVLMTASVINPSLADTGDHGHGHISAIGGPGDPSMVSRTIEITLTDNRYDVPIIDVTVGRTIRLVLRNRGMLLHEFNIGTPHMHEQHQEKMLAMMQSGAMSPTKTHSSHGQMKHDDSNSVIVEPGETKELIWHFNKAPTKLEFACNIPGHYQAGMKGGFRFTNDRTAARQAYYSGT